MRRNRTLRSCLFRWLVGAITLAVATGSTVAITTHPESATSVESVAHHVAERLGEVWDDPVGARAYLAEIRDVTGFEAELERETPQRPLPAAPFWRAARRGGVLAVEGRERILIPIARGGTLVGALHLRRPLANAPWRWWRFALGLLLVLAVLSVMAGGIANELARPLERLARAADSLGGGDLSARTTLEGGHRRWVAQEVRDVAVSFNRMAERIEAMVRGQRELLGAISHELRSPLGRARVALEIARERLPTACQELASTQDATNAKTALDAVEQQLGAVDSILGDLLDVTRAGLADLRKRELVFADWLLARAAEEPFVPPVDVRIGPAARHLVVAFDAPLLARAVHNLLVNAHAHGHPAGRPVELSLERSGRQIRVVVRDRGPGFPPGFAERAFEPFVRGDSARVRPAEGAGFGLGLTIVRRIVDAHGGRAFVVDRQAQKAQRGPAADGEIGGEVGFDLPLSDTTG